MVTVADVRALALTLPRTSEHLIRDRVKFRVGSIVYVAFSRDETTMGFGYPKQERDTLIAGEPDLFFLPRESDLRFHWVCCHLALLDPGPALPSPTPWPAFGSAARQVPATEPYEWWRLDNE
jgi:hypothetical protein